MPTPTKQQRQQQIKKKTPAADFSREKSEKKYKFKTNKTKEQQKNNAHNVDIDTICVFECMFTHKLSCDRISRSEKKKCVVREKA